MAGNIDFTNGPIKSSLFKFALPIFLGNLFQQLYNTADSLIVGNFLGAEQLAAVSSSGPLIFMMVGFFQGIAIGAGVVIARAVGAKNRKDIERAVHTDIAVALVSGVILTIAGVLFTPTILRWMKTPENIMPSSIEYFRVYTAGLIFNLLYNFSMGILNACGDSRHPLYYLILSSCINLVLDLLFIGVFRWGVGWAAFATIMSQAISSILCIWKLTRVKEDYRLDLRKIRLDREMTIKILRYGLPSGVQNSVIAFANTIVQTNINSFSSAAVAGSGSYAKIEGFVFLPITCFSMAITTFIGQNIGANKLERVKKGAHFAIFMTMALAETFGIFFFIFAPKLIGLFNSDPEVIAYGTRQARIENLFFCFLALSHCIAGIMRGAGKAKVPMYTMFGVWCVLRVTWITIAMHFFNRIEVVYVAYPLTWTISSIIFVIYYLKADWLHGPEKDEMAPPAEA